jgi:Tfp pilus assembly protein FimT
MRKAFTLVEIAVTLGIIVLIAGIGVVAFFAWRPNLELRTAARDIVAKLGYVQQRAVAEQIIYGIHFDWQNDTYTLIRFVGETEETLEEKSLPERVDFQSVAGFTNDKVKFISTGSVIESGEVILINTNDKTITIDVRPSGYVKTH